MGLGTRRPAGTPPPFLYNGILDGGGGRGEEKRVDGGTLGAFVLANEVTDRQWTGALVRGHLVSDSSQRMVATQRTRIVEEK